MKHRFWGSNFRFEDFLSHFIGDIAVVNWHNVYVYLNIYIYNIIYKYIIYITYI